jgi:hypothetical protein
MDPRNRAKRTIFDNASTIRCARAAIAAAAMAALAAASLLAAGRGAAAEPPCRTKIDSLGGYDRFHAWCPGRCVKVQVDCAENTHHVSSYWRYGYNKAECHLRREGGIVRKDVDTCPKPPGGNLCCT